MSLKDKKIVRTKKASDEASLSSPSTSDRVESKLNVLFVCNEWNSSRGGLSTFNREFALNLAQTSRDDFAIHCYVCQSSESDRDDARKHGVNLITAKSIPGTGDRLEWLRLPPSELPHPDVVIGHGRKFGTPAYCIVQNAKCKWVQFVHVFCEDLGKYKQETDAVEENEKKHKEEIKLCKESNAVVAVGLRLQQKYSRCLPDTKVHIITPGILDKFVSLSDQKIANVSHSPDEFSVFVFGRGSYEDLALKGYDIIANALGSLGEKFKMTFVGSPEGQHSIIMDWFLQNTNITRRQLTVRGYCNQDEVKEMFYAADLVAMPSRTEGFGLIALEAISAGVPVLLTSESGIAEALKKVDGGESVIIDSEDPKEWSQKIRTLSKNKPDGRLKTSINLRESYNKIFPWDTQCEKFKEIILKMLRDNCCAESVEGQCIAVLAYLALCTSQLEKCKIPVAWRGALKAAKAFKPGADLGGGAGGMTLPEMTCSFLINTVQSLHSYTKSAVSFDMYSQQLTYLCPVKSLLKICLRYQLSVVSSLSHAPLP